MARDDQTDGNNASLGSRMAQVAVAHAQGLDLASCGQHASACLKYLRGFALIEEIPNWTALGNARFAYAAIKGDMGNSLTSLGQTDYAVAAFDESLGLLDSPPDLPGDIGPHVVAYLGQVFPADVAEVLEARPEQALGLFVANHRYNRGYALDSGGRFDEAAADYGKAIAVYQRVLDLGGRGVVFQFRRTLFRRGQCWIRSDRPDDAADDLERGAAMLTEEIAGGNLDFVPDVLETVNALAELLAGLGKIDQAADRLNTTVVCAAKAVANGIKSDPLKAHLGRLIETLMPHADLLKRAGVDWKMLTKAGSILDVVRVVKAPPTEAGAPRPAREATGRPRENARRDAGGGADKAGWSTTPYDDYAYPPRDRTGRQEKDFDFFISYKSEDVSVVRRVADMLIANGFRVWFAEYIILLADRDRFSEAIADGIRRSKYGLAFTRDLYVDSDHCRGEMDILLDPDNCGPQRVLEIRLRDEALTHEQYPQLARSPQFDFDGSIDGVLEFVRDTTSLKITAFERSTCAISAPHIYRDRTLGYTLDVGGWEDSMEIIPATAFGAGGPDCRRDFDGLRVIWNLIVGPFLPNTRRSEKQTGTLDDRAAYDFTLECIASPFLGFPFVQGRPRGVHLFHIGGYSQVGLTYWFAGFGPPYWTRRYSIVLPHPANGAPTEFAFTTSFFGPFAATCRHAYLMDRVVESLRWQEPTAD